MANRTKFTHHAREKFLAVLRETCNVAEAARAVGISRRTAYDRRADAQFAIAWDEAEQEAADKLEREAWRRAVEGTQKPIVYKGDVTGHYLEYSDRMLELLLKAHRPERFGDKVKTEVSGPKGDPIKSEVTHVLDPASAELIANLVK